MISLNQRVSSFRNHKTKQMSNIFLSIIISEPHFKKNIYSRRCVTYCCSKQCWNYHGLTRPFWVHKNTYKNTYFFLCLYFANFYHGNNLYLDYVYCRKLLWILIMCILKCLASQFTVKVELFYSKPHTWRERKHCLSSKSTAWCHYFPSSVTVKWTCRTNITNRVLISHQHSSYTFQLLCFKIML